MSNCCHNKEKDLQNAAREHRSVLWVVLIINLAMFFVEIVSGLYADSLALVGDSLDMLGDAITYASSLFVVGLGVIEKAKVAKLKAWIMLVFGAVISGRCIYRSFYPEVPDFSLMYYIGALALGMNLICLFVLTRHKDDDINMKSVWICSRNDIVANISVLIAAFVVSQTGSSLPDLVVGIGLAFLFTKSALGIFRDANTAVAGT